MDDSTHLEDSSVYIAPLRIQKAKGTSSTRSQSSKANSPRSQSGDRLSQSSSSRRHITPVLTPKSSRESLSDPERLDKCPPFLRASYQFQPTYTPSSSTVTLPLCTGDLILVHSIHGNGWADGTVMNSGARGWLPTNYCEAYYPENIQLLLQGCVNLFEQFRVGSQGVGASQIAVSGLVAGVKQLLDATDCLVRDSENVRSSPAVRKYRKALLTELAGLVKAAKRIPGHSHRNSAIERQEINEDLILRSFKIAVRGVRFLDIWYEEYELSDCYSILDSYHDSVDKADDVPPTPSESLAYSVDSSLRSSSKFDAHSDLYFCRPSPNLNQPQFTGLDGSRQRSHPLPSTPHEHPSYKHNDNHHQFLIQQETEIPVPQPVYAMAQLNTTHDTLLSHLGSYIGRIHLQSRATPQLQRTQEQSIEAARELLAVVEIISARHPEAKALYFAKEEMCKRIDTFSTNRIEKDLNDEDDDDDEGEMTIDGRKKMMDAATGCVRGAGQCVVKSKSVLEKHGDFELDSQPRNIGLGITTDAVVSPVMSPTARNHGEAVLAAGSDKQARKEMDRTMMPPPPVPEKVAPAPPPKDIRVGRTTTTPPLIVDTSFERSTVVVALCSPASAVQSPGGTTVTSSSSTVPNGQPSSGDAPAEKTDSKLLLNKAVRADSIGSESIVGTESTGVSSIRGSELSMLSRTSTRATTPEPASSTSIGTPLLSAGNSMSRVSLISHAGCESTTDLAYNSDGQIIYGTLPALIEKLTSHGSTPDASLVATFYLTFRLFTTPRGFAEGLIARYDSVATFPDAMPVLLRVYNVFKGWLELHWRKDADTEAHEVIEDFAVTRLAEDLPQASKRLLELLERVSTADGPLVPRLLLPKGDLSPSAKHASASPTVSKSQLNSLRAAVAPGGSPIGILDLDPADIARQFTLKESTMFCAIRPEELLNQAWNKIGVEASPNVRAMSTMTNDLTLLVQVNILNQVDMKRRCSTIKHWIKIAEQCMLLNNYNTLMAIVCGLNSSNIMRLKKTFAQLSDKTLKSLEEMRTVVEISKNFSVLRSRLRSLVPPALPFLGTYLTDLTFNDEGNSLKRKVSIDGGVMEMINFTRHTQTARIISEIQRFQVPYPITEVPELQAWMDFQLKKIHKSDVTEIHYLYRQSCSLEPRDDSRRVTRNYEKAAPSAPVSPPVPPKESSGKLDMFSWAHVFKTPAH